MEENSKELYDKLYENSKKAIQIFGTKEDKKMIKLTEEKEAKQK